MKSEERRCHSTPLHCSLLSSAISHQPQPPTCVCSVQLVANLLIPVLMQGAWTITMRMHMALAHDTGTFVQHTHPATRRALVCAGAQLQAGQLPKPKPKPKRKITVVQRATGTCTNCEQLGAGSWECFIFIAHMHIAADAFMWHVDGSRLTAHAHRSFVGKPR